MRTLVSAAPPSVAPAYWKPTIVMCWAWVPWSCTPCSWVPCIRIRPCSPVDVLGGSAEQAHIHSAANEMARSFIWVSSVAWFLDRVLCSGPVSSTGRLARRGADADADAGVALGRLGRRAVRGPRREVVLVPASAARDRRARGLHRARPLVHVAGHVVDPDRAARRRMRADLVGAERERLAAVRDVDVRVVGRQRRAAGIRAG